MIWFRRSMLNLIFTFVGYEKTIKIIEYIKGLYRYPFKMIGRNLPSDLQGMSDVLVIAAHPDDEILGLGTTLLKYRKDNVKVTVVYVTNGSSDKIDSWVVKRGLSEARSKLRFKEGVQGLGLINISQKDIFCLGFPDGGTHRYIKKLSIDISFLIKTLNPNKIYTHCIEGGHKDHDITSFVVKSVCNKLGFTNLFEWAEYNPQQSIGANNVKFLSSEIHNQKELIMDITNEERKFKQKMLACHKSQNVERYYMMGETIRLANTSKHNFELHHNSKFKKLELEEIFKL